MHRRIIVLMVVGRALSGCDDRAPVGVAVDARPPDRRTVWPEASADQHAPDRWAGVDRGSVIECPTPRCESFVGTPCTEQGTECGQGAGRCLLTSAKGGFCTCDCAPDNPLTPLVNEDTCGDLAKQRCGKVTLVGGSVKHFCLRSCTPKLGSNDCTAPLACQPISGTYFGQPDQAFCALHGCAGGGDCPIFTDLTCQPGKTTCPPPSTCVAAGGTLGRCALPGVCDLASGLCAPKPASLSTSGAAIGAPCADDRQCDVGQRCLQAFDNAKHRLGGGGPCSSNDQCCSGSCSQGACTKGSCPLLHRNGYCTIEGCTFPSFRICPAGSSCNRFHPGGLCQKVCDPTKAGECRGLAADLYGDYECRSWDRVLLAGAAGPITTSSTPVCDFGPALRCSAMTALKLNCTALGLAGNPTQMACRTLDGKLTSDAWDPFGFCLDATPSGTQLRPDPVP